MTVHDSETVVNELSVIDSSSGLLCSIVHFVELKSEPLPQMNTPKKKMTSAPINDLMEWQSLELSQHWRKQIPHMKK